MSPAILAAAVTLSFFATALLGSVVVFRFLKSTAQIQRRDVQLGGAVAGFVVMFYMLNHFYNEQFNVSREDFRLVEEAHAQPIRTLTERGLTEVSRIAASPLAIRTTAHDLNLLDKNHYFVEPHAQLAMVYPTTEKWEVGRIGNYQTIGLYDVPIFHVLYATFGDNAEGVEIFGIRSRRKHELVLDQSSFISSIPLTLNVYTDGRFVSGFVKAMGSQMSPDGQPLPEDMVKQVQVRMVNMFDNVIKSQLPVKRTIQNGIFITVVDKEVVKASYVSIISPHENPLEAAASFFSSTGFIPQGTTQNSILDNDRGILSYNASVTVTNATIDGSRGNVIINHVGFIIDLGTKVAGITIVYVGTDPLDEYKLLETEFSSLQLGAW
jgi:hypothetical protein